MNVPTTMRHSDKLEEFTFCTAHGGQRTPNDENTWTRSFIGMNHVKSQFNLYLNIKGSLPINRFNPPGSDRLKRGTM